MSLLDDDGDVIVIVITLIIVIIIIVVLDLVPAAQDQLSDKLDRRNESMDDSS